MIGVLVLRSYGDYVILLNAIRGANINTKVHLHVSMHLKALHNALNIQLPKNISLQFIEFGVKKGILSFFTNKHFISLTNIKELFLLRKHLSVNSLTDTTISEFYLEQFRRSSLLSVTLGKHFNSLHNTGNIYESYYRYFKSDIVPSTKLVLSLNTDSVITIFPDSRKREKTFTSALLSSIQATLAPQYKNVRVALFGNANTTNSINSNVQYYSNFEELVEIINAANFIVSSDSLPAHLAELYKKPHWIFYGNKVNAEWLTPSATASNYYSTFDKLDNFKHLLIK